MAIEWKDAEEEEPEVDGQYLVYCYNHQISSDLIDIARFENGKWGMFRSCLYGMSVVEWSELNWPSRRIFHKGMNT